MSLLDRERTIAPRGYNRWLIPPAALAVHLCIGEIYAFSVFKVPLKDHFDTKLTPIGIIFSIATYSTTNKTPMSSTTLDCSKTMATNAKTNIEADISVFAHQP